MSVAVLKTYSDKIRQILKKDLLIVEKYNKYKKIQTTIPVFIVDDGFVYIPLSYYIRILYPLLYAEESLLGLDIPKSLVRYPNDFNKNASILPTMIDMITLRDYQQKVYNDMVTLLNRDRCLLLAVKTAWGKTKVSIKLAVLQKKYILTVTNKTILVKQWNDEFNINTNHVSFIFKSGKELLVDPPTIHPKSKKPIGMYIISPNLLAKARNDYFNFIGTFIIDEMDGMCSPVYSVALCKVQPQYIIGLTATPNNKENELSANIIPLFCGSNWIIKMNTDPYKVDVFYTDIIPEKVKSEYGDNINWHKLLTSIEMSDDVNMHICSLVVNNPKEIILILVRTKLLMFRLQQLLKLLNQDVETLYGSQTEYKKTRILIAINRKAGVGFDDTRLTMGIIAYDEKLIEQQKGRLRGFNPYIVEYCHDRKDKDGSLSAHSKQRLEWHASRKGIINKYEIDLNGTSKNVAKQMGLNKIPSIKELLDSLGVKNIQDLQDDDVDEDVDENVDENVDET